MTKASHHSVISKNTDGIITAEVAHRYNISLIPYVLTAVGLPDVSRKANPGTAAIIMLSIKRMRCTESAATPSLLR